MLTLAGGLLLYVGVLSIILALMMFADKRRAMAGEWRIPEATLLLVAFAGGALGGKLGQRLFRHKTRKQPFAHLLNLALFLNPLLIIFVVGRA